jgi:hypothetical protein
MSWLPARGSTRTHSPLGDAPIIDSPRPPPHRRAATGASRSPAGSPATSAPHAAVAFQLPRARAAAAAAQACSNTPSAAVVSTLVFVRPALTLPGPETAEKGG